MKNEDKRSDRTARKKKRDRELLSLGEERACLQRQIWDAPLVPLDEPYQKGWERFFVLTKEARRREDAESLAEALKLVENYQWCLDLPFRQYRRKRRKVVQWDHHLSGLRVRDALHRKVPESLLKYFQVNRKRPLTRSYLRVLIQSGWSGKFWFRFPEFAVSKIQPYWITHRKVILPEAERRLGEIDRLLDDPAESGRLNKLRDCSWKRFYRWEERLARLREKRLADREIEEEIIAFERKVKPGGGPGKPFGWCRSVLQGLSRCFVRASQEQTPWTWKWDCFPLPSTIATP